MTQTVITLRTAGDVVEAVPFLLGFAPTDKLVVIGLSGGQARLTVGMDLVGDRAPDDADQEACRAVARRIVGDHVGAGSTELILVAYSEESRVTLAGQVALHAIAAGLQVRDLVAVSGGSYASLARRSVAPMPLTETSAALLEAEGMPPTEAGIVEQVAESLFAGDDAEVFGAALDEERHRRTGDRHALTAELVAWLAEGVEPLTAVVGERLAAGAVEPTPREAGLYLAALEVPGVRDLALTLLTAPEVRAASRERLAALARRAPGRLAAAPLTLWGLAHYLDGHGRAAREGLTRALAAWPGYVLARAVLGAYQSGVPAEALRDMVRSVAGQARLDLAASL